MDIFTSLLLKVFSGIMYGIYWVAFRLIRIAWWLSLYLLLSLGAGAVWLARGGHGKPADTGRFGRYVEDGALWQDDATGAAYPASCTDREHCEVTAELSGQYWRQTMLNRLMRRGALWRYKFSAVVTGDGQEAVAAWCEFPNEAWKDITLDHLAPAGGAPVPGIDPDALEFNRSEARYALEHLTTLLGQRGWNLEDEPGGQLPDHWYAIRFWRPVIAWDAPVTAAIPAGQATESPAQVSEQADGQP